MAVYPGHIPGHQVHRVQLRPVFEQDLTGGKRYGKHHSKHPCGGGAGAAGGAGPDGGNEHHRGSAEKADLGEAAD